MKTLKSFKPIVDENSRVLVLGSMPGPEALRKKQYYGFDGNHFWHIVPRLFRKIRPVVYEEKIQLLRDHGLAVWDVLESCVRISALDSAIKKPRPNKIPELLAAHPGIRAVFINGRFAHAMFVKHFGALVDRPVFYLPSTSPANAAMPVREKEKKWKAILKFLDVK